MVGKRIGLVIGNNYPNSNKELKFAVNDAKKMKEILENRDLCGFDEVIYLPDKTSKDASIAVEKILKKADNDFVFIYYSGHGKKDFEGNLCLLFNDTEEDTLLTSSLTFEFISKCIRYPSRKSVAIVLDCCYSGIAGIKDSDSDVMEVLKKHTGSGLIILTSTGFTGSPTAREDEKLGHGIFTHYLIEGLEKGYADQDNDGYISIDDLYEYSYKKTTENCKQSPKREGRIEGTFLIGKNPQKLKENEYYSKINKLVTEFGARLPPRILSESQTILRKYYRNFSDMEQADLIILDYLDSILKSNFLPGEDNDNIEGYIEVVQHLKGLTINNISISPIRRNCSITKLEPQNTGNTGVYETGVYEASEEIDAHKASISPSKELIQKIDKKTRDSDLEEPLLVNLGNEYFNKGEYKKANEYYDLGNEYFNKNEYKKANGYYEQAFKILKDSKIQEN